MPLHTPLDMIRVEISRGVLELDTLEPSLDGENGYECMQRRRWFLGKLYRYVVYVASMNMTILKNRQA